MLGGGHFPVFVRRRSGAARGRRARTPERRVHGERLGKIRHRLRNSHFLSLSIERQRERGGLMRESLVGISKRESHVLCMRVGRPVNNTKFFGLKRTRVLALSCRVRRCYSLPVFGLIFRGHFISRYYFLFFYLILL